MQKAHFLITFTVLWSAHSAQAQEGPFGPPLLGPGHVVTTNFPPPGAPTGPVVFAPAQPGLLEPRTVNVTPKADAKTTDYEVFPAKLSGLKWQGASVFVDSLQRSWRLAAGSPLAAQPSELAGWGLATSDGRKFYYSTTGHLFALSQSPQTATLQPARTGDVLCPRCVQNMPGIEWFLPKKQ